MNIKYFGFPVNSAGIDFCGHIASLFSYGISQIHSIQCSEWNPYTRYVIYNTFLHPKIEYSAPLTYEFHKFIKHLHLLEPFQKLQNEIITWIFNSDITKVKVLHKTLIALNDFVTFTVAFNYILIRSVLIIPFDHLFPQQSQRSSFILFDNTNFMMN